MADRFTLWNGAPPAGWSLPNTTQQPALGDTQAPSTSSSPRFTPYTGGQSGGGGAAARFTPESGGFDPSSALGGLFGAGSQLAGLGGALGAIPSGIASGANQAFSGLGGLLSLVSGIRGGNPIGAALGGIQAGSQASSLLGGPSISSALGSLLPAAETGAAGAAGAALPAGASGLIGLGLAPFAISLSNWLMGQGPPNGKMAETRDIRRDFGTAYPQLQSAGSTWDQLMSNLSTMSPDQQRQALQGVIDQSSIAQGAIPTVSQFTSTQGGRHGASSGEMLGSFMPGTPGVPALDVSGVEAKTPQLYMQAYLENLAARDKLAQLGAPASEANMQQLTPMLDVLGQQGQLGTRQFGAGPDPYTYDPFSQITTAAPNTNPNDPNDVSHWMQQTAAEQAGLASPGHRVQTIAQMFGRLSPQYAGSPLDQAIQSLMPYLGGGAGQTPRFTPA